MKFKHSLFAASLMLTTVLNARAQEDPKPAPTAAESKSFLAYNKALPGVITTASGLQYKVISEGEGAKPVAADKVSLHFNISLTNGTKILDNFKETPWQHHIDKAMPGMQEAITMMPVGSKWVLYIPAELAFGKEGYEDVPPGATLICEVELLDIVI